MDEPGQVGADEATGRTGARGIVPFLAFSLLLPITLFGAAGRLDWGMGWAFVGVMYAVSLGTRLLLLRTTPDLIAERSSSFGRADMKPFDRVLVPLLVLVCPLATWIVAGLQQRFSWPPRVPFWLQVAGLAVILLGAGFSAWAMLVNRYFSAVVRIQSDRGQTVVTSGPYRIVRHPGYAGSAVATAAMPLMLDATWAFVPTVLALAVLVVRTALEDRTLKAELPGYADYARTTRFRLLPGLW